MIQPWQIEILDKMSGFKKGELTMMTVGRRSGKSQMSSVAFQRLWDEIHRRPVEDLKLTEGTVYGSRYHCVEPVGGNWREMETWCYQMFGNAGDKLWGEPKAPEPVMRWYMNNRKFWFRDEKDRLMFVMKWR
jgi:hypothetical protein